MWGQKLFWHWHYWIMLPTQWMEAKFLMQLLWWQRRHRDQRTGTDQLLSLHHSKIMWIKNKPHTNHSTKLNNYNIFKMSYLITLSTAKTIQCQDPNKWRNLYVGLVKCSWQRKSEVLEVCPSATLSTTNLTWTGMGMNPGLHNERLAATCVCHGTVTNYGISV